VVAGGGHGHDAWRARYVPRTGDVLGFCTPDNVAEVCEKIVTIQRDWGDRSDRKHARLKYTIERVGLDRFNAELHARLAFALARHDRIISPAQATRQAGSKARTARRTISCSSRTDGRAGPRSTGLRAIAEQHDGRFILTANQNLVIADIPTANNVMPSSHCCSNSTCRRRVHCGRNAMACVALRHVASHWPKSERYLPQLIDELEREVQQCGLANDEIMIPP